MKILTALFLLKPATLQKALNDGHLIAVKKDVHRKNGQTFQQTKYVSPEDAAKQHLRTGKQWQVQDKPGVSKEHANKHFTIKGSHETAKNHFHVEYENGDKGVVSGDHILKHSHVVDNSGKTPQLFDEQEIASLPDKTTQPFKSEEEIYKSANEALDHFKDWLDRGKGLCSKLGIKTMTQSPDDLEDKEWTEPGGMLFIAPLKGKERATSKVTTDYGGDWSQLKDVVRGTIAVDTLEELAGLTEKLKKGGMKLAQKPKDRFAKPTEEGYRDVLMNITFPNGHVGELQLHVKVMTLAKTKGHNPYVAKESIRRKYPEPPKKRGDWDDTDRRAYEHAHQESVAIYSKAWQSITKGGQMAALAKAKGDSARMDKGKYQYFEKDDAIFRGSDGTMPYISEIKAKTGWEPYKGNCEAVVTFGNKITEEEANKGDA